MNNITGANPVPKVRCPIKPGPYTPKYNYLVLVHTGFNEELTNPFDGIKVKIWIRNEI